MASFPTSVKTFTTRSAGQTIAASHINDIQDEVTALEDALVNGTGPINTSNVTVRRSSTRGLKVGSYFDHRELDSDGSTSVVPGISAGAAMMSYNAVYNPASSRWEARAGGRSNAFVMQEGTAWMVSCSSIAGGAGSPITWVVSQKWYAGPSFNIGIGSKFDASLSTGTVGGEPQGRIHSASEGNHSYILEAAGDSSLTDPNACAIEFRKSRGSLAAPLKVESGDGVGGLIFYAKAEGGTPVHLAVGSISCNVDAATSSGSRPAARISLQTSSNGGAVTDRLVANRKGAITAPSQPRCNVYSTLTAISVNSGSTLAMDFLSETFDVGGLHSTSVNPDRVTIPTGSSGVYWCHFQALVSTGARAIFHLCRNSSRERSVQRITSATFPEVVDLSALITCDAGDILNITAVGEGSSFTVGEGGATESWAMRFQVQKVW